LNEVKQKMVEFEKGTLDGAYGSEFVVEIGSVGFVIVFVVDVLVLQVCVVVDVVVIVVCVAVCIVEVLLLF